MNRLRNVLAQRELPAALILRPADVSYLTAFTGSTAALLITTTDAVLITDARYGEQARRECAPLRVAIKETAQTYSEKIAQEAREFGLTCLAVESDYLTLHNYEKLQKDLEGITLRPEAELVAGLRLVKDLEEIERIRRACELADATFAHALTLARPGVRERDLAIEIEYFMKKQGAEGEAFPTIVASGARSALPHGRASAKPLEVGDFVTFDFGAMLDGYCSDLTRTVVVGRASERQKEIYQLVLDARAAALATIRPGAAAKAVDAAARELIAARGYGEHFGHSLGHSLGREVHEGAGLGPRSEITVQAGMVFTVEPGVYLEGWGGVRVEDDIVVTADGYALLTHAPRELIELPTP